MDCPGCRYDLPALGMGAAVRCPECGREWGWEELQARAARPRRWRVMVWGAWPAVVQAGACVLALRARWDLSGASVLGLMVAALVGFLFAGVGIATPFAAADALKRGGWYAKRERRWMFWAAMGLNAGMAGVTYWMLAMGVEKFASV